MLPTLFLVKIALTIPGSLWFYINVRINFSISGQNAIGIGRDHIEVIDGCRVLPRAQRGNGGQLPGSRFMESRLLVSRLYFCIQAAASRGLG